eukprot:11765434-Prorocentrum_lima.AAC.1
MANPLQLYAAEPYWYPEPDPWELHIVLSEMWELRFTAVDGRRPSVTWRHPSGYLPTGGPLLE